MEKGISGGCMAAVAAIVSAYQWQWRIIRGMKMQWSEIFDDYGVELVVVNQESKSHEEELRDLIAIVNSFSCIYGKRGARRIVQTIKEESIHG